MEQTPTFKCIKPCEIHHAAVGDIIKMSDKSLAEFDAEFPGWRDKFIELTLADELAEIKQRAV